MRRSIFFLLFLFALSLVCSGDVMAQDSSKKSRKSVRSYRRAQSNALDAISTLNMVKGRDFTFYANQIEYTDNLSLQNVYLNGNYYITVTPTMLNVLLPIYGSSQRTGQPTIWKELDFFTSHYTYSYEEDSKGYGYTVTIKAVDSWSFNNFTFVFEIRNDGYCRLAISTNFVGPSYITGSVNHN